MDNFDLKKYLAEGKLNELQSEFISDNLEIGKDYKFKSGSTFTYLGYDRENTQHIFRNTNMNHGGSEPDFYYITDEEIEEFI